MVLAKRAKATSLPSIERIMDSLIKTQYFSLLINLLEALNHQEYSSLRKMFSSAKSLPDLEEA